MNFRIYIKNYLIKFILFFRIFTGGWNEKFEHITTFVRPLCEAEHINKTVALYKAQLLSGNFEEMSVEVSCNCAN